MPDPLRERFAEPGSALLPLRGFLALVFLDGGISKIADSRFLDAASPSSMHSAVQAVRVSSPIGGLLGPVAEHSFGFGLAIAVAELAVGLAVLAGLCTRIAALGGMVLALSLWLTVSWGATPWFTSADLVYLVAFTPLLIAGSAGPFSADRWLDRVRLAYPDRAHDRLRRALLGGALSVLGAVLLGGAALFRRSGATASARRVDTPSGPADLTPAAAVPIGGARQVNDPSTGSSVWVMQLASGQFTAVNATCPHQGCVVNFVSSGVGFACPCHGSRFDVAGRVLNGPARRGLTTIAVAVESGQVRTV